MPSRLSSLGALVTATTVGVGFAIVAGVLWVLCTRILTTDLSPIEKIGARAGEWLPSIYDFKKDGTPFLRGQRITSDGKWVKEPHDLDGNVIENFTESDRLPKHLLWAFSQPSAWRSQQWSDQLLISSDSKESPSFWYFIQDSQAQGRGYFVGYEKETRQRVGFIGTAGYRETEVPIEERFDVPLTEYGLTSRVTASYSSLYPTVYDTRATPSWFTYVSTPRTLYRVDLRERTVKSLFETKDSIILAFSQPPARSVPPDDVNSLKLAVRTEEHISCFNVDGSSPETVHLPACLVKEPIISLGRIADGSILATTGYFKFPGASYDGHTHVYRFDLAGTVLSMQVVPNVDPAVREILSPKTTPLFFLAGPFTVDVGLLVSWAIEEILFYNPPSPEEFLRFTVQKIKTQSPWSILPLLHLYTLLWAFLAWRRETRYGSSPRRRWMWTVFVYLLGLPALMGYLAHRKWPKLDECPSCKAHVPVDHDSCAACGNEWPLPARNGIEVIDA